MSAQQHEKGGGERNDDTMVIHSTIRWFSPIAHDPLPRVFSISAWTIDDAHVP